MTKKSIARQTRDANQENDKKLRAEFKKSNTAWDDINVISTDTRRLLNEIRNQVNGFFSIEDVNLFIPASESSKANAALATIRADFEVFEGDLNKIANGHAGKSGPLLPDENIMQVIELSEAYINYSQRFEGIVTPTYTYLLTVMQMVEKNAALAHQAELAAAQVTDVEAKPVAEVTPV